MTRPSTPQTSARSACHAAVRRGSTRSGRSRVSVWRDNAGFHRLERQWEGDGTERRRGGAGSGRLRAPVVSGKGREERWPVGRGERRWLVAFPRCRWPVEEKEEEVRGKRERRGERESE